MSDGILLELSATAEAMKNLIAGLEVVSHDKRLKGRSHALLCKDVTKIRCKVTQADGCYELVMDI